MVAMRLGSIGSSWNMPILTILVWTAVVEGTG